MYWYEMSMTVPQGDMIMKFLVPGFPYEADEIQSIVMKMGNQPAMEVSEQMMGMMRSQMRNPAIDAFERCDGAEIVGTESVTVPAGTIEAIHLRMTQGDVGEAWISTDLPFGMVQFKGPDGEVMLLEHGTGASTKITETPMKMPGMGND